MPATCFKCGHITTRYVTRWVATTGSAIDECSVCEHPPTSDKRVGSMFSDLTLDHVTGEDGKPLRVTSIHQLREAEKKYHFKHWTSNMSEANFDAPPQAETRSIAEIMDAENKWLYPEIARPMLKEMEARGELLPVASRK